MNYSFDTSVATKYGLKESIFIQNMIFWISKNVANEKHYYDSRTWTFNSVNAYEKLFPFWTARIVRSIIDSLIKQGVLVKGNYNKSPYDRTCWYAFKNEEEFISVIDESERKKEGKSICHDSQIDLTEKTNEFARNDEPIPDIKHRSLNTDKKERDAHARVDHQEKQDNSEFYQSPCQPVLSETQQYFQKIWGQVNSDEVAEGFFDYYTAIGWMVGGNMIFDWKAKARTWVRKEAGMNGKKVNTQTGEQRTQTSREQGLPIARNPITGELYA